MRCNLPADPELLSGKSEAPSPVPLLVVARRHIPDLPATLHRQLLPSISLPPRRGLAGRP